MRWVGCRTSRLGWTGRGISRKWPSGLGLGGCWIQSQGVGETFSVQGVQGVALLTGKQVVIFTELRSIKNNWRAGPVA